MQSFGLLNTGTTYIWQITLALCVAVAVALIVRCNIRIMNSPETERLRFKISLAAQGLLTALLLWLMVWVWQQPVVELDPNSIRALTGVGVPDGALYPFAYAEIFVNLFIFTLPALIMSHVTGWNSWLAKPIITCLSFSTIVLIYGFCFYFKYHSDSLYWPPELIKALFNAFIGSQVVAMLFVAAFWSALNYGALPKRSTVSLGLEGEQNLPFSWRGQLWAGCSFIIKSFLSVFMMCLGLISLHKISEFETIAPYSGQFWLSVYIFMIGAIIFSLSRITKSWRSRGIKPLILLFAAFFMSFILMLILLLIAVASHGKGYSYIKFAFDDFPYNQFFIALLLAVFLIVLNKLRPLITHLKRPLE